MCRDWLSAQQRVAWCLGALSGCHSTGTALQNKIMDGFSLAVNSVNSLPQVSGTDHIPSCDSLWQVVESGQGG